MLLSHPRGLKGQSRSPRRLEPVDVTNLLDLIGKKTEKNLFFIGMMSGTFITVLMTFVLVKAQIIQLGAENVKVTADLLGYTMNVAAKICAVCPTNLVLIGESLYRSLHVTRKNYFKEERLPGEKWNLLDATTNRICPLYRLVVSLSKSE